jgi:DNA-directed RNA polymerase subunit RPC12/RpoP
VSKQQTLNCRMCGGVRPHNGSVCLGCGTPVANAQNVNRKPKQDARPACPKCGCRVSWEIEPGRYSCRECMGVFEREDVSYLHHDPAINAERRERQSKGRRR